MLKYKTFSPISVFGSWNLLLTRRGHTFSEFQYRTNFFQSGLYNCPVGKVRFQRLLKFFSPTSYPCKSKKRQDFTTLMQIVTQVFSFTSMPLKALQFAVPYIKNLAKYLSLIGKPISFVSSGTKFVYFLNLVDFKFVWQVDFIFSSIFIIIIIFFDKLIYKINSLKFSYENQNNSYKDLCFSLKFIQHFPDEFSHFTKRNPFFSIFHHHPRQTTS